MRALIIFALSIFTASASAAEVRVFAAASLTDVLTEIAAAYQKGSGDKIIFNFGASSSLARQIGAGAPADLFFSADEMQMDTLAKRNLLRIETRRSRLSNSLVIVVANDSDLKLTNAAALARPAIKRVALADPAAVPAGVYAKQYLEKLGLWASLAPKVIPTENVRAALAAIESGNVDAAIVYKTDAAISKKTKIALEIPPAEGPAISYPMALLSEAKEPVAAQKFLNHLNSPASAEAFWKAGFLIKD